MLTRAATRRRRTVIAARRGLDSWASISPVVPFTQGVTSIGSERIMWVIARDAGGASSYE
jgi:hypothetical protein